MKTETTQTSDVLVMTWPCDIDWDAVQNGYGCDANCPCGKNRLGGAK